jgi:hypothetical protein
VGIYFLTADGSSPIEIYRRMRNVYGGDSINVSSDAGPVVLSEVKRKLVIGLAAADQPRQRQQRPQRKIDALIRDNRRNTRELRTATGIGKSAVMADIENMATEKLAQGGCRKRSP